MMSYSTLGVYSALWLIISERKDAVLGMTLISQGLMTSQPCTGRLVLCSPYEKEVLLPEEKCYMQMNLSFHNLISEVYLDWWDESILGFPSLQQRAKFLFHIDVICFQHFYSRRGRGERGGGGGESNTEIFIVIFYCYSLLRIQQLNHCPPNNEQIFSKLETCCLDEAGLLNSNLTAVI